MGNSESHTSVVHTTNTPIAHSWVIVSIISISIAASLAEICSVFPTSGGVYYWSHLLSKPQYAPIASWITGWLGLVQNFNLKHQTLLLMIIYPLGRKLDCNRIHQLLLRIAHPVRHLTMGRNIRRNIMADTFMLLGRHDRVRTYQCLWQPMAR